jgi:hypothetical protein
VADHSRAELTEIMMRHGVAGAPVLTIEEVLALPALTERWLANGGVRAPAPPVVVRTCDATTPP